MARNGRLVFGSSGRRRADSGGDNPEHHDSGSLAAGLGNGGADPRRAFDDLFTEYARDMGQVLSDPLFKRMWERSLKMGEVEADPSQSQPIDMERWLRKAAHCRQFLPPLPGNNGDDGDHGDNPELTAAMNLRRTREQMEILFGEGVYTGGGFLPFVSDSITKEMGSKAFKDIDISLPSLRSYPTLLALQFGGVLSALNHGAERKIVWQIGAGDGLLTFALKSLAPNTAVIISDAPENIAIAATVLKKSFPRDRLYFYKSSGKITPGIWNRFDIFFIPPSFFAELTPPRLDLTFRHLSSPSTSDDELALQIKRAHELDCLFLYDMQTVRSATGAAPNGNPDHGAGFYWQHVMPVKTVLPAEVMFAMNCMTANLHGPAANPTADVEFSASETQHVIGWRKILP